MSRNKPDEFVSFVDHAIHFVDQNKIYFVIAVFVLLGIWLAQLSVNKHRENVLLKGSLDYYDASTSKDSASLESLAKGKTLGITSLARLSLLQKSAESGSSEELLNKINLALENAPDAILEDLLMSKAQVLWDLGKLQEALDLLSSLVDSKKETDGIAYAQYLKARILEDLGRPKEAVVIYKSLNTSSKTRMVSEMAAGRLLITQP